MRLDQVVSLMDRTRGIGDQIAIKMGYSHIDWIAKDIDMMVRSFVQHSFLWEVPEIVPGSPLSYDAIVSDLYDLIIAMPAYTLYNDGLTDDSGVVTQGQFMLRDYQILTDPDVASGYSVRFRVTFVDLKHSLM